MELKAGYKKTELGVIPEDWQQKKLGELGIFLKGSGVKKDEASSGYIACVRYGEIYTQHNEVIRRFNSYISESVATSAKKLKKGDLLFAGSGETKEEIGKCVAFINDFDAYAGGDIVILRLVGADPIYMGYCCNSPYIVRQKASKGQGDAVVHISSSALSSILVNLPPLPEQQAIANALSDVDELIASLDELIAKKRDLKQATMQQLLTGKTRLAGFSGEWEIGRLEHVIESIVGGGTPSRNNPAFWGKEIPWVTVKDFATFDPLQTQEWITHIGLKNSASHLIPAGTLITSTRMALGKAVIYNVNVAINQDLKALFFKPNMSVKFMYYWFEFHAPVIEALGSGSTVKGIALVELKRLQFKRINFIEQEAIAKVLSDMDSELVKLEQRRDKTIALKQGMMQELLTGRTRLV